LDSLLETAEEFHQKLSDINRKVAEDFEARLSALEDIVPKQMQDVQNIIFTPSKRIPNDS